MVMGYCIPLPNSHVGRENDDDDDDDDDDEPFRFRVRCFQGKTLCGFGTPCAELVIFH